VSKHWRPYALHIIDAIDKIRRIEARGDVVTDEVLYAATLRHLQTLSEATQMLPQDLKNAWPGIPWREISGFRNVLVHNHLGDIDPQTVKGVLEKHLEPLLCSVAAMLEQHPETPSN